MIKRIIALSIISALLGSTCIYAASAGSPDIIRIAETEESNLDEFGNEKGYSYYDYWSDMPLNITYNKKDKNNNPDNHLMINFTAPNVSTATYNLGNANGTIKCDGVTYTLSKRNEDGNYEKVTINNRMYTLTDGLITSRDNSDYYYNNTAYNIDAVGNFYSFKHQWVEDTLYNDVYGEWKETDELLFKYEIPFNTLWKNRPLSEEEMEDYLNGPGFNLNPDENIGQYGSVNIIGPNRKIEVSDQDSTSNGKPNPVNDPLNPMKAKSTKKNKKAE